MAITQVNKPFTLLVADDDPFVRESVDLILRSYGYRLLLADSGHAAYSILDEELIDLAVIDLIMPGISGLDVIAHCRRNNDLARMPIIAMTEADTADHCERAFDLGATTYVSKPLHSALFTHTIWYALRNEARETELRRLKARLGQSSEPAKRRSGPL